MWPLRGARFLKTFLLLNALAENNRRVFGAIDIESKARESIAVFLAQSTLNQRRANQSPCFWRNRH